MRAIGLFLVAAAGCTRDAVFEVSMTTEPVAVGATVLGQLRSQTCSETDCDSAIVKILSMEISPPGVFDTPMRGATPGTFQIPAIAEGSATFTISGNDGEDTRMFTRALTAVAPNRVTGALSYNGLACPTPVLYGPGLHVQMPFAIWRDDTKLYSDGLVPFAAAGASIDLAVSQSGTLILDLPSTAATATVSSTLDPTFAASLEVIASTAIDGIALSDPDEPISILDAASLTVTVTAGGAVVCGDNISRTATTLTPDVCKIRGPTPRAEWSSPGMHSIEVVGTGSGRCTITVTNAITGPTATTSFEVTM